MKADTPPPSLRRKIGPIGLLFTGITSVIGSGWLFAAMYASQIAGPAAILSWVIGAAIVLVIALVYAETVTMLPIAGSIARIPFFSHGSMNGYIAGWLCFVAYLSTAPIEVMAILDYATNYFPGLTVGAYGDRVLTGEGFAVATALMCLFVFINLMGVAWLATSNTIITFWKLLIPSIAPIALMLTAFDPGRFTDYGGFAPSGMAGVFAAIPSGGILFSFIGFRALLDMAGEVRKPQRDIPFALLGTIVICATVYLLLQVAFIGVIPAADLKDGWSGIAATVPGGPFAAFAALLGLKWVALTLYVDAAVSPGGTGLAYVGVTARLNYAMSENGHFPRLFLKLNRAGVPFWAIVVNLVFGLVMMAPFPSWQSLVSFTSSAATLSLVFGPLSLIAMRHQLPDHPRPFRVRWALPVAALCFVLTSWVVYWTGWETNGKVLLILLIGLAVVAGVRRAGRGEHGPLHLRQAAWMVPYILLLGVTSYLGGYGGGLDLLPEWLAMAVIAAGSLAIFFVAVRTRLPDAEARALVATADE